MTKAQDKSATPSDWLSLALFTPALMLEGVVISDLIGWFLVPLGVPNISTFHAMGLGALWAWFRWARPKSKELRKLSPIERLLAATIINLIIWGAGAVAYWCGGPF